MPEQIIIPRRFNGPPDSANGGYACGAVAELLDAPAVEVTLRLPPPLDLPLDVVRAGGGLHVRQGEALVAEAGPSAWPDVDVPASPSSETAHEATARYSGHESHLFPTCFVCGPLRDDGLRLFPGDVGNGVLVAPWRPAPEHAGHDGAVTTAFVWAALDCPGGWATDLSVSRPAVLGRMAVRQVRPVPVGAELVVIGWGRGADGRKLYSGSAICDPEGAAYAVSVATWIRLAEADTRRA